MGDGTKCLEAGHLPRKTDTITRVYEESVCVGVISLNLYLLYPEAVISSSVVIVSLLFTFRSYSNIFKHPENGGA